MFVAFKLFGSAVAWLVITLFWAVVIELYFGTPRSGFVTIATLPTWALSLYLIWRKRPAKI
jgi:hypothetical protein